MEFKLDFLSANQGEEPANQEGNAAYQDYLLTNGAISENGRLYPIVIELLACLGEDPSREGLRETPRRVSQALSFFTKGYKEDIDKIVNGAIFETNYEELVLVKDIDFYSLCEHHLLPFFGKCHVAYFPSKKIIGLSKLPKIVEMYTRRLQVQERLTSLIAEAIQKKVEPKGVAVIMEAKHLCMMMRGVEKQNAVCVTSSMLGVFRESSKTRMELLELIRAKPQY